MSGLLVVEGRRFVARAAVQWLAAAAVLVALVVVLTSWFATRPPDVQQIAAAEDAYAVAMDDWAEHGTEYVESCRDAEATEQAADPEVDWGCDTMEPQLEQYLPSRSTFAGQVVDWTTAVGWVVLALALAAGVTAVTAEISAGSLGTWLTFVPRRGPVYASKVGAAAIGVVLPAAVTLAVTIGGTWAVAAAHGRVGDVDSLSLIDEWGATTGPVWPTLGGLVLRLLVAVPVAAAVGAALGFLVRSAAVAIGLAVGWLMTVDGLVMGLLPALRPWSVLTALTAWVRGGTTYYRDVPCAEVAEAADTFGSCTVLREVTTLHGGVLLAVVAALLLGAGVLVFRRRDVG